MNVLWLCNVILPRIGDKLGIKYKPIGGWLDGLSNSILNSDKINLTVCFPNDKNIYNRVENRVAYYGFVYNKHLEKNFINIINYCKPDVIHIFGTEKSHSNIMVKACKKIGRIENVLISIQGLTSVYSKHYYCNLPFQVIFSNTFHDIIRKSNIYFGKKEFEKAGKIEKETIRMASNVTGRTDWDFAAVKQINPKINYYFCNEILRSSFYENYWEINNIERYSIFVSQCNYPIKGFHLMLEALSIVLKKFPDVILYTTGNNSLKLNFSMKLRQNSYNSYIRKLILKLGLTDKVKFLGQLSEKEMVKRFLLSHVFVSCSSIENSPNSVGEAMILGVPTVCSNVGGVKNMIKDNVDGYLYPYDEPYMLAYYIEKLFSEDRIARQFSENARKHASITHNKENNFNSMMKIYEEIKRK